MLTKGKVWGADIILQTVSLRLKASAYAMNYLETYYTSREDLIELGKRHPDDSRMIREQAIWLALRRDIVARAKEITGEGRMSIADATVGLIEARVREKYALRIVNAVQPKDDAVDDGTPQGGGKAGGEGMAKGGGKAGGALEAHFHVASDVSRETREAMQQQGYWSDPKQRKLLITGDASQDAVDEVEAPIQLGALSQGGKTSAMNGDQLTSELALAAERARTHEAQQRVILRTLEAHTRAIETLRGEVLSRLPPSSESAAQLRKGSSPFGLRAGSGSPSGESWTNRLWPGAGGLIISAGAPSTAEESGLRA